MLLAAAASYVAPGESSIGVGKTSLSDTPHYLRLIERAIANDSSSLWNTIKTNPAHSARSSKNVRLFRAQLRVFHNTCQQSRPRRMMFRACLGL